MRNMKKWLVLLLAVVMLVSNLPVTAMATENWAPLALETRPAGGGILQVDILATEGSIVADGKLVLTYDPAVLTYEATEINAAWNDANAVTLSVNDRSGKLILAFASADAANEGVLFSVRFSGAACDQHVMVTYCTTGGGVATEYCKKFAAVEDVDIKEVSLVKRSAGEISELKAARGIGLNPEHLMDNYVWYTGGDWHGFSGNAQPDVSAPYIVCPKHTKQTWEKYEEEKRKEEEEKEKEEQEKQEATQNTNG